MPRSALLLLGCLALLLTFPSSSFDYTQDKPSPQEEGNPPPMLGSSLSRTPERGTGDDGEGGTGEWVGQGTGAAGSCAPLVWEIETVDSEGSTGWDTSLVLDAAGWPHISYRKHDPDNVEYAYYDGTNWFSQTVHSPGILGRNRALALDTAERPHISFYDFSNGELKHAYYVGSGGNCGPGSTWVCQTLDQSWVVGAEISLALDSTDRPHIAYYDYGGDDLNYAYYDGSAWQIQVVDSEGNVGRDASLALDTLGRPHISYRGNGDLKYAFHDGSAWKIWKVDTPGYVGWCTSLALDSGDYPHVSYRDDTNGDLKYAYRSGTTWITETVDSEGRVGGFTSLALDAADWPHVSYYDWSNGNLKYACYDGTAWQLQTVDTGTAGWVGISLALDAAGRPHIGYHGEDNLKYARAVCAPVGGVAFTWTPLTPTVGLAVEFTGSAATGSAPITYSWDFGDGSSKGTAFCFSKAETDGARGYGSLPMRLSLSAGPSTDVVTYTYAAAGAYTVTMTATNPCGSAAVRRTLAVVAPIHFYLPLVVRRYVP